MLNLKTFHWRSNSFKASVPKFIGILFFLVGISYSTLAQKENFTKAQCQTEMTADIFQSYLQDKRSNASAYSVGRSNDPFTVPVRVVGLRRSDGTGILFPYNTSLVNFVINDLNEYYAGTNISFEHCGDPIFIDSDYYYENAGNLGTFQNGPNPWDLAQVWENQVLLELAYFSSDANAYSPTRNYGASSAEWPCTSSDPIGCQDGERDNLLYFINIADSENAAHEFGHHLGVLHTFQGAVNYNIDLVEQFPNDPSVYSDHPYGGNFKSRELIIRSEDPNATFTIPNCQGAGDLCCDTPAAGLPSNQGYSNSIGFWPAPGFPNCCDPFDPNFDQQCCDNLPAGVLGKSVSEGCLLYGPYEDYNRDKFEDQPNLDVIARNIMTYSECDKDEFTADQIIRMHRIYDLRRSNQYKNDLCGNHKDQVTHWDGPEIMNEVSIQNSHNSDDFYANTFTNYNGEFSSILYANDVNSKVRKLGSEGLDNYTDADWREGLSILDIVQLQRGIVLLDPLNGYQKLAGDVNGNGLLTITDVVLMQRLLVFYENDYPNQNSPWKFIPEYIPFENSTEFHADPFNMTIDGVSTNGMPIYTDPNWEYEILDGNGGLAGFHGYKLGDLNKSSGSIPPNCFSTEIEIASQPIPINQTIDIGISLKNNINLEAIQLSLNFHPSAVIEAVSSIYNSFSAENNYNIITTTESKQFHLAWFDVYGKSTYHGLNEFTISVSIPETLTLDNLVNFDAESANLVISEFNNCNTVADVEISADIGEEESIERHISQEESETTSILVYPNPSNGKIEVNFSNKKADIKAYVELFNMSGENLMKVETIDAHLFLDGSKFPAGIYQLKVIVGNQTFINKIVFN